MVCFCCVSLHRYSCMRSCDISIHDVHWYCLHSTGITTAPVPMDSVKLQPGPFQWKDLFPRYRYSWDRLIPKNMGISILERRYLDIGTDPRQPTTDCLHFSLDTIQQFHVLRSSFADITMTSEWAGWRLKSTASRLFTQPFIQGADQRKHQSSASLAFVRWIHRWLVNSPHTGPVTQKMLPFDDVIMDLSQ